MGATLLVAGTVLGAYGSVKAGKDTNKARRMQAGIDEENARLSIQRGESDVIQLRKNIYRAAGAQTAANAASGLASSSIMDILAETHTNGELDVQNRRYNAQMESKGLLMQADLERFYGKSAEQAGKINAASDLLTMGSKR